MSDLDDSIGNSVRRFRGAASQKELASAMSARGYTNWSQTTVWQVEAGKRSLRLAEASALAGILGETVEALLGDDGLRRARLAAESIRKAGLRLAGAAVAMDHAQEELRSALEECDASLGDLGLGQVVEAQATLPIEAIAASALAPDGGAVGIPRHVTDALEGLDQLPRDKAARDAWAHEV